MDCSLLTFVLKHQFLNAKMHQPIRTKASSLKSSISDNLEPNYFDF